MALWHPPRPQGRTSATARFLAGECLAIAPGCAERSRWSPGELVGLIQCPPISFPDWKGRSWDRSGKVAFITGAARGRGRSHALTLAREGADIIAVDICRQAQTVPYPMATHEDLAETVKEVEALDRRIIASEVDIRDLGALTAAVDEGVAELGRLDIVLANAGISTPAPTLEMDELVWDEMIEINLTGQWKTIKAAVPHIIANGRGESGDHQLAGSVYANPNTAPRRPKYLVMLMKVLARGLAPHSIRVNMIHPPRWRRT